MQNLNNIDPDSLKFLSEEEQKEVWKLLYRLDPVAWVNDHIIWKKGQSLTPYQEDILCSITEYKRVSVRGPHGLGKTALAALVILWFACTREACGEGWKVVTTAGSYRQLTKFLWPEIHKWARQLNYEKLGRRPFNNREELKQLELKLQFGAAFGAAVTNSELIEGAHADQILYVFDESKAIPDNVFDAAEGALGGGERMGEEAFAIAISTPGDTSGRFYQIHTQRDTFSDWHIRHVKKEEVIKAGRMSIKWAEARKKQWGEDSAIYQNKVEGQFKSGQDDGLVPVSWIEQAFDRWDELDRLREMPRTFNFLGVDVGRTGDETVVAIANDGVIMQLRSWAKKDTMETVDIIRRIVDSQGKMKVKIIVDIIGIGAGVFDRLRQLGYMVVPFVSSESARDYTDRSGEVGFFNKRAAALWNVRERLDPTFGSEIALPRYNFDDRGNRKAIRNDQDGELLQDLSVPRWSEQGGRIKIESKDEIKKRLGKNDDGELRSTDRGDAVAMVLWIQKMKKNASAPCVGGEREGMKMFNNPLAFNSF